VRAMILTALGAAMFVSGCEPSDPSALDDANRNNNVHSRESKPPDLSPAIVEALSKGRLSWMLGPSRDLQKRMDRLLDCPGKRGWATRKICDRENPYAAVVPGDDKPLEHLDAWIIVGDDRLNTGKVRPYPLARFPFRIIDELFPDWSDRDVWLRKAILEANHRPCAAAIKVDGAWIIVDGEYVPNHGYLYVDFTISMRDSDGARVARCEELHPPGETS